MDIQKEREAFELWAIKASGGWASFSKSHGDVYANNKLQFAWETWRAAKVQAVPEGFVLVSIDRLAKAVDGIDALFEEDCNLALGQLLPIQQDLSAIIEAQEPNHEPK